MSATGREFGIVWQFRTKRFRVALELTRDRRYRYDGDDENGETQARLESGEYVAFDSKVFVELDGEEIGADYLGGSVYGADDTAEFFQSHWKSAPEYRNTLAQKAANRCIGHYFPDMVARAIELARDHVREMTIPPYIREGAL